MVVHWREGLGELPYRRAVRGWVSCDLSGVECEYRLFVGREVVVAVARLRQWSKVVYCEVAPLGAAVGVDDYLWRKCLMSFLRRVERVVQGKGGGSPFRDPKLEKSYPALYEYLTAASFPDSTPRKPSSLTLFAEDGQLKCCLVEKTDNLVLFAAGKTLDGLLAALEGLLTADEPPWRSGRDQGQRGGGRSGRGA